MKQSVNTRTKKKAMIEAMKSTLGNVSASTDAVGIDRSLHYKWMKSDEKYNNQIKENLERSIDFTEAALFKRIQCGNTTAIIFYLKTKGKHRGYFETNHIFQTDLPENDLKNKTDEEIWEIINRKV